MNPGKKLHVVAAGCPALLLLLGGLASCRRLSAAERRER